MKRLLVFILSLAYLVTTTGTSVNLHFCMGKLADWSLWGTQENKICGKCGMVKDEKPNGCCSDEHKWVKIQDAQKASDASFNLAPITTAEPLPVFNFENHLIFTESEDLLPKSHAPPLDGSLAIHKRNCVFLI